MNIVPPILPKMNFQWRGKAAVAPRPLRSTVGGADLMLSTELEGNEYFVQLNRDWNAAPGSRENR